MKLLESKGELMSKSVKFLLAAVILAGLIGCSSEQEIVPFNDKDITMKVVNAQ
jgi:outer membrane murein-binding lipoprotein Lpp